MAHTREELIAAIFKQERQIEDNEELLRATRRPALAAEYRAHIARCEETLRRLRADVRALSAKRAAARRTRERERAEAAARKRARDAAPRPLLGPMLGFPPWVRF